MYTVEFSDSALRQIKKLDKPIQERIISAVEKLYIRPQAYITKLVGKPGYKMRVGDYRLIIDINENQLYILIIKIGHRSTIYQ